MLQINAKLQKRFLYLRGCLIINVNTSAVYLCDKFLVMRKDDAGIVTDE